MKGRGSDNAPAKRSKIARHSRKSSQGLEPCNCLKAVGEKGGKNVSRKRMKNYITVMKESGFLRIASERRSLVIPVGLTDTVLC